MKKEKKTKRIKEKENRKRIAPIGLSPNRREGNDKPATTETFPSSSPLYTQ